MAIVKVSFNCGCGSSFHTIEEAAEHADAQEHILTASGIISPTAGQRSSSTPPSRVRLSRVHLVQTREQTPEQPKPEDEEFVRLRARLQSKH